MANTDTDHDTTNEQSMRRTWLILAALLLIIAGGYYLSGGSRSDEQTKKQADTSKQKDDTAKQAPENDKADATDKQAAIRGAEAAAQRGEPSETLATEGEKEFRYVVGSGESYTGLARRAVAASNDKLSPVERVAAETKLTQDAGDQSLAAGQEVTLSKSAVDAAIKWAQNLSADQKAAWQPYADMVAW